MRETGLFLLGPFGLYCCVAFDGLVRTPQANNGYVQSRLAAGRNCYAVDYCFLIRLSWRIGQRFVATL